MRYAGYYDCDICNGKGIGMSLFVTGCHFHCEGCFNSELWDFSSGKKWTQEVENEFLELVGRSYIDRVTIVGGEPLCYENMVTVYVLIDKIRRMYPEKKIWLYSGYTLEEVFGSIDGEDDEPFNDIFERICRQLIVQGCDVFVDGRFEIDKKDLSLAFRGSSNQRVIDVKKTLEGGRGTGVWLLQED